MRLRGALCMGLLLAGLAVPILAGAESAEAADSPREELVRRRLAIRQNLELHRRDGTLSKGELVDLVEREYVILSTADGQMQRINWDDIAGFRILGESSTQARGSAPAAEDLNNDRLPADQVRVRVEGDSEIVLKAERTDTNGKPLDGFLDIGCKGGQTCRLFPKLSYRAEAEGMVPSYDFRVPSARDQKITIRLRSGSSNTHTAGVVLSIVGGGATLTALIGGPVGALSHDQPLAATGAVLGILGPVCIIAGIVMVVKAKIGVNIEVAPLGRGVGGVSLGRSLRLTDSGLAF